MSKDCNSAFLTLGARSRSGYFLKCFRIPWKVTFSRNAGQTGGCLLLFGEGLFLAQCPQPSLSAVPSPPRREAPGSGRTFAEYQCRMCVLTRFSKCPTLKLREKGGRRAFLERRPQRENKSHVSRSERVAERGDSPSLSYQLTKMHSFLFRAQCLLVS